MRAAAAVAQQQGTYDVEVTEKALYKLVEMTVGIRVLLMRAAQAEEEGQGGQKSGI